MESINVSFTPCIMFQLLETIIKNCGDIVHMHVAEKDLLHEMVKIVRKKVCLMIECSVAYFAGDILSLNTVNMFYAFPLFSLIFMSKRRYWF